MVENVLEVFKWPLLLGKTSMRFGSWLFYVLLEMHQQLLGSRLFGIQRRVLFTQRPAGWIYLIYVIGRSILFCWLSILEELVTKQRTNVFSICLLSQDIYFLLIFQKKGIQKTLITWVNSDKKCLLISIN